MASFMLSGERLEVSGMLDGDAERKLRAELQTLLHGDGDTVTVDMSEVTMIASACIGALVVLWIDLQSMAKRARLKASAEVMRMLDMTGLTSVLQREGEVVGPE